MSDTILGGDFTIYYLDENRQKRIEWTGAGDGERTMNELYSALQEHFDESIQMDDGVPMSAQTPTEYTLGIIDTGDLDPWYISYETLEHLTGGALKTAGWTHVDGTAVGIIVIPVTNNDIDGTDIGDAISGATTGNGILLDVIEEGATDYLIIRPDSNAAGDNFTTAAQQIDMASSAHQADQTPAYSHTGEQVWANPYSIGTFEDDTHLYLYQGAIGDDEKARVYSIVDATQDWWGDGHLDRCVYLNDFRTQAYDLIDGGYITCFARKGDTLYDSFEVANSPTSGGRNPIPLATAPDLDNETGYRQVTFSGDNYIAGWSVGDEFSGDVSGARAIITAITTPGSTQTLQYYLVDDPLTDFNADENVTNEDAAGTGDIDGAGPTDDGPALDSWYTNNTKPTVAYTETTFDINDDTIDEHYGITIDCNQNPLSEVYEWIKWITRRGNTGTGDTDGIEGEQYIGGEVYLEYSGAVAIGTIDEGDDVVQATTGATGVVVSHDLVDKILLLRNIRGTFSTADLITSQDNAGEMTPNIAAVTFSPKKQAPLGTFAGGTFFGARGVLLTDWISASDENSFQLTPIEGGTVTRPIAIALEVTNLVGDLETEIDSDRVCIFRLTGLAGSIDKEEMSCAGGEAIGDPTIVVDAGILQDVPGKATGGVLRIRDADDNNKEYRIRYASWDTVTFTLANIDIASAAVGTNTTTVKTAGGELAAAKRGDIVVNNGNGHDGISYIVTVDDTNTATISPAITGQTDTDHIEINAVPIALDNADDLYVPLLDQHATTDNHAASIVFAGQIWFRVVVRNSEDPVDPIIPFSTDDTTGPTATSRSNATIRTPDTIKT